MSALDDYNNLISESNLLFRDAHYAQAIATIDRADSIDPLASEFSQIQKAMQQRDFGQANVIAETMLQQASAHPRAVFTLSHLCAIRGAHEERLDILEAAIRQSPANLFLRRQSIMALEDCGSFAEAIEVAKLVAEIDPSFTSVLGVMQIFLRHGFNDDVLNLAEQAYALCAENSEKLSEIDLLTGQAHKILGHREAAISAFRECLKHKPASGAPWWALADMKDYHFSDMDMRVMEQLLPTINLAPDHCVQVSFALAKAYELRGDLSRAMDYYEKANSLHGTQGFQSQNFTAAIETLSQAWTAEAVSAQAEQKKDIITPIFILGMPRSGSTLVEQILASHSQIEGTMEMMVMPSVKRQAHLLSHKKFSQSYLEGVGDLDPEDLMRLGQSYLTGSSIYRKDNKSFVIDKLPNNFEHIGLIHKILPHARIIDVRRNPMDCGYSLYKQYFRSGANYSYDLTAIGAYYNGYLSLMDHWHELLPGKVLQVQYETLVRDTKDVIQGILKFIGVEFESDCLEFYKNTRPVRTASSEQVRQPIYSKSVGAWRSVEKRLAPLRESLGKSTIERFDSLLISEPS